MSDSNWVWLFAIWFVIQLTSCTEHNDNREILKELKEIKQEIKNER